MSEYSILQLTQLVVQDQIADASLQNTPQAHGKVKELTLAYNNSLAGQDSDFLSFRWYVSKKGVELAKTLLDNNVRDIDTVAEKVHQAFIEAAQEFIENPDKFASTKQQRDNNVINNILDCFKRIVDTKYTDLTEDSDQKRSCLITANTLIEAYKQIG